MLTGLFSWGFQGPDLRQGHATSQESFADHFGVHRTFMGTVEREESNRSFLNLVKVAGGLGITLSELLSGLEKRAAVIPQERGSKAPVVPATKRR
jgi:transcriptional regulator with XRE-family HTH domain